MKFKLKVLQKLKKKKKLVGDIKDLLKGKRDIIYIGNMKLEKEIK